MRVFKLSTGIALGSVFLLSACASMYNVRQVAAENQVPVQNQGVQSLSSKKLHIVQVGSVQNSLRQFDSPRFNVTFVNQGQSPVEFSTDNVTVTFNGQPAQVVSYEAQIQDVQNRLSFYGLRAPVFYKQPAYNLDPRGGFGGGVFLKTDFNDRVDVQQAFADFDRIQKYSLKPKVVGPGQQTEGQVIVGKKFSASSAQSIRVTVQVDKEFHSFDFNYLLAN